MNSLLTTTLFLLAALNGFPKTSLQPRTSPPRRTHLCVRHPR